jgi:hypothetical protein
MLNKNSVFSRISESFSSLSASQQQQPEEIQGTTPEQQGKTQRIICEVKLSKDYLQQHPPKIQTTMS